MRHTVVAMLILLACCSGCVTQTRSEQSSPGAENKVINTRTIWIWQKEFWEHK